ncbi:MAG: glutamine--fructose-6-phosphate transaminase (isomerizing) [Firmicutes bacterium]|nr:glutamine--fructose-6-phosphate transaminase (isomerizing) [Bacillota bacterium]
MCGIVGYVGPQAAAPVLIEGLKRLEYRGYDSAGVAVFDGENPVIRKSVGRLTRLEEIVKDSPVLGNVGLGHTRWATHGRPSDTNAHPHTDCGGQIVLVHNGIIENYMEIREQLEALGHRFESETDTEVLAHLVEENYQGDLAAAVRRSLAMVRGSYAIVVMSREEPDRLVAARKDSPLIVGLGDGENLIASDIPALLGHTRQVYVLSDGEQAVVTRDSVTITDPVGNPVKKDVFNVTWDAEMAEKGGYAHFMLKEIHEQPRAIRDTMSGRIDLSRGRVVLRELPLSAEDVRPIERVFIIACGTASYAGQVGRYVIESLARIPTEVDLASEFRYRDPMVGPNTLAIVVSQSGETADTLAGLREAKRKGARVIAITNVVGSSVSREADHVIYTWAGPEIAVASTKAYLTQLVALTLLGIDLGTKKGTLDPDRARSLVASMGLLPGQVESVFATLEERIRNLAREFVHTEHVFFIGRGLDFASSTEGALKLKEISYIHAEAYAAGELKHGTLALVVEGTPVFALVTQDHLKDKMLSNIREVKARDARVIAIAMDGDPDIEKHADEVLRVPRTDPMLAPVLTVVPMQLFAYYAACARGCDVDKPRNLAKSVTVE